MKIPIETKRYVIRRFEKSDLPGFLSFMLNEESTKYLMFEEDQKTESGARVLFDYVRGVYDSNEPVHSYAVAEKENNQYMGSCGYAPYDDGIVECYYSVNQDETGRGIATEVLSALVKLLSSKVEVRAYCHPENAAAHAVAKKSGFKPRGIQYHKNFGSSGEFFVFEQNS
ncbi:MAG: GNAT family N-acetyltransferase [Anaerolineaceae bacterium]|nr:GNAT family N-acetyltransferase [Anaerolineaceae bacterium]